MERERLREREKGYKTAPDYGHFIITRPNSERFERRMNRKVKEIKRLNPESDSERIRALREDVAILAFKVFKIVGRGVIGDTDDTYINLIVSAVDSFKLSEKTEFSHYFRSTYARRRKTPLNANDQFNYDASYMADGFRESSDDSFDWLWDTKAAAQKRKGGRDAELEPEYSLRDDADYAAISAFDELGKEERNILAVCGATDLDELSREQIAAAENARQAAAFVDVLTLLDAFQNHRDDNVTHTSKQKLYRRLFFTEDLTFSVKKLANREECVPFEHHERDAMRLVEIPFQDCYTSEQCRSIASLWACPLKDEAFGARIREIRRPGDSGYDETKTWTLPAELFQEYLRLILHEEVSRSQISNQRKNYRKMREELEPSRSESRVR